MGWERVVYAREDLYRQVWEEPVIHVAKRIGISDVALAKVCRSMSIPLPGRGYWARKAAGYAPRQPILRPRDPKVPASYVRHVFRGDASTAVGDAIRAEVARLAITEPCRPVPSTMEAPHVLVVRSQRILQRRKRRIGGTPCRYRCLDISAIGLALDRACRIMDTVIKELEARGHTVEVTAPKTQEQHFEPSCTIVHVADSVVQVGIDEAIDKVPLPLPEPRKPRGPYDYVPRPKREYEYRPTGRLRLRLKNVNLRGATEVWSDRKSVLVEANLSEFVASVLVAAERQRLDRIEAEERRQQELHEERRRQAIELHNDAHGVLEHDLDSRLKDWRRAREIEAFATAVREGANASDQSTAGGSTLGRWLDWAGIVIQYLDRLALDDLAHLRRDYQGYKLRSRFGWSHELTTEDVIGVFFTPIEDLIRELELKDHSQAGEA